MQPARRHAPRPAGRRRPDYGVDQTSRPLHHDTGRTPMTIQTLIDTYYSGLGRRTAWEAALSDDFSFTGGSAGTGSQGKAQYAEVLRQFGRMFDTVNVIRVLVDGDNACV